MSFNQVAARTM